MEKKSFMDLYLSGPTWFKKIVDISEWVIIIGTGLAFPNLKLPQFVALKILGIFLIVLGVLLHYSAHRVHPQAHEPKEKINKIVTNGIYSIIRHPCYTSYFLFYFGIFFILGFVAMLIPILLFCYLLYQSAIKEEEFLLKKFGEEYKIYMQKVKWRFIPKIF